MVTGHDEDGIGRASARHPEEFDHLYDGTPPWDIGRPQPVFARLADGGAITGRVLDVGCGTGEHVLMAAERGLDVTGVDLAPKAIAAARRKAGERGLEPRLLVWDALRLDELGEQFDTVLDSGVFHVFDDEARRQYVSALGTVLAPGGNYLMCCFSDRQPGDWGPRRVSEGEIREAFASGWSISTVQPARFETNLVPPGVEAWLVTALRA